MVQECYAHELAGKKEVETIKGNIAGGGRGIWIIKKTDAPIDS